MTQWPLDLHFVPADFPALHICLERSAASCTCQGGLEGYGLGHMGRNEG